MDATQTWKRVKQKCTAICKQYSGKKADKQNQLLRNLYKYEETVTQEMLTNNLVIQDENTKLMISNKIKQLESEAVKGSIYRS